MPQQVSSLKTGEKFKDTPIGKIPVDWEVIKLGALCIRQPEYGATVASIDKDKSLPRYIRITDIREDGKLLESTWQSIKEEFASPHILQKGDFLFARSGATVGKTYLYLEGDGKCAFAGYMIRFRPNPTRLLPAFLFHYTHSSGYYNWIKAMLRAGAQPNINAKEYSNMPLPIPPLREQEKIAEILSTVDEAIEKTAQIIEKTKEVKKGLMQKLLTQGIGHKKFKKTEIGEIPVEWEVNKLKNLCVGQPEYGANCPAIDKNIRLPRYIRITDISDDGRLLESTWQSIEKEFAHPYILDEGDSLFARSGATVGKTYLYNRKDGECAFAGYMIRFRPNPEQLSPEFLFQFTHSNFYYNWVKGMLRAGAQPNINAQEYSSMSLPIPPLKEQKRIVSVLNSLDEEIEEESRHKEQLESLKKALMQVLLTGQVRVQP